MIDPDEDFFTVRFVAFCEHDTQLPPMLVEEKAISVVDPLFVASPIKPSSVRSCPRTTRRPLQATKA